MPVLSTRSPPRSSGAMSASSVVCTHRTSTSSPACARHDRRDRPARTRGHGRGPRSASRLPCVTASLPERSKATICRQLPQKPTHWPPVRVWLHDDDETPTSKETHEHLDHALGRRRGVRRRRPTSGPTSRTPRPAACPAASPWRAGPTPIASSRRAKRAVRRGARTSLARRTQVLFAFRELLNARKDELAAIITAEHGKVHSDALGEISRGQEVVEFACGIAHLLKGGHSEERLDRRRRALQARPARRGRHHQPVQLPGDGADVVLPGRHRRRQRRRAQAQ